MGDCAIVVLWPLLLGARGSGRRNRAGRIACQTQNL
jgi:hypothetical protein